jgi:hypothetical protein
LLIAAAMLALPAAAQARSPEDAPIADSLPSQGEIDFGSQALHRAIDGLLQIDIAPLANAIDPYGRRGGPKTLGDMGRRDDPYFEDRVHHSIDAMADGAVEMSHRMRVLEPALRRSLEDVARSVEDAMRRPYDRDDRDYDDRGY